MFINNFDPVAFELFSFQIRWYSLSYIFGILLGWIYCKKIINDKTFEKIFDDLIIEKSIIPAATVSKVILSTKINEPKKLLISNVSYGIFLFILISTTPISFNTNLDSL